MRPLIHTESAAQFWTDRQHAQFKDAIDALAEELDAKRREVTFDDALEKLANLHKSDREQLMRAFHSDRKHFLWQIDNLFDDAVDACARGKKFMRTYCSQCGRSFPAGDSGYSHCSDHSKMRLGVEL
ncbi:hypothetical protein B7759_01369 [Burkholderia glumae]|uniref:hypothetical protein n=1 Tax=Burkholderia glumae TaxID=337 RepID=UPI001AE753C9|nr:hypothetical protein [Burkholderia glumae]QTP32791.1 hypothetical protein B7759_01369 [Burkholderia glumae]